MFHLTILSLINFLVGIITLVAAAVIWTRRPAPGVVPFTIFMLAVVVWIFVLTLQLAAIDFAIKIFLAKLLYFVAITTAIMWLCFDLAMRVPDCQSAYEILRAKGAIFLIPSVQ